MVIRSKIGPCSQLASGSGNGYPWEDGDILYAADLNAAFVPITGGTMTGPLNIVRPPETSPTGPYSSDLLIQKTWNVNGGPAGTVSSLAIQTTIEGAPGVFIWPLAQTTRLRTTAAPDGTTPAGEPMGQHVGIESAMFRELGPSVVFMYHGQSIDSTGLVQPATATIGMELDIQANGPESSSTSYNPGHGARAFITLGPTAYPAPVWEPVTAYALGVSIRPATSNGFVYVCMIAGTSGGTEPTWPLEADDFVVDGSVTWKFGTAHAMQVSRGIAFGGSGTGANPASYGAGIFMDGSMFYDAMIDLSLGILADGGVKDAAIRLAPGMPIDFAANGTDAGQNTRTLRHNGAGGDLIYQVASATVFSVHDTGAVVVGALSAGSLPGRQLVVAGTAAVGISTEFGTFATALRLADGQRISFNSGDNDTVSFVSGQGLTFNHFGADVAWVDVVGVVNLGGVKFLTLPTNAANDAAAAVAGVPVGRVYRNGSVLQVRVA